MPDWDVLNIHHTDQLAGYAVMDALGVRLGYLSGWVTDADGRIAMLKVAVPEWSGSSEFLVPVGSVTLISDERSRIQLRDVTKRRITRTCFRFTGELPDPRILKSLMRAFPAPRVSVLERLESPAEPREHRTASGAQTVGWMKLGELALPRWTPLSTPED